MNKLTPSEIKAYEARILSQQRKYGKDAMCGVLSGYDHLRDICQFQGVRIPPFNSRKDLEGMWWYQRRKKLCIPSNCQRLRNRICPFVHDKDRENTVTIVLVKREELLKRALNYTKGRLGSNDIYFVNPFTERTVEEEARIFVPGNECSEEEEKGRVSPIDSHTQDMQSVQSGFSWADDIEEEEKRKNGLDKIDEEEIEKRARESIVNTKVGTRLTRSISLDSSKLLKTM